MACIGVTPMHACKCVTQLMHWTRVIKEKKNIRTLDYYYHKSPKETMLNYRKKHSSKATRYNWNKCESRSPTHPSHFLSLQIDTDVYVYIEREIRIGVDIVMSFYEDLLLPGNVKELMSLRMFGGME